ncbi:MAG: hypothetical protein ABSD97_08225 [Acidimicrobiales bacterium]
MTVGWRRGSFPSARRSSGRTVVIVVVAVVLAIVIAEVAADVVDSGRAASRVEATTYVAEVIPVVDESTTLSSTMHLVRNARGSLDRTGIEQALSNLVTGTAQNEAQLGDLGVPAPSTRSGQLLEAALAARARGSRDLAGAVTLAIGPSPVAQVGAKAAVLIVQSGKELMAGDRDYRAFVGSLPRSSGRGRLPASRWVDDPSAWAAAAAASFVAQLASLPKLAIHDDLVIVAMTVQPPVVRIDGLPPTTTAPPTTTPPTTTSTTTSTIVPGATSTSTTSTSTTTTSSTTTTTTMQLPPAGSTSVLPPTGRVSVVLVVANAGNEEISGIWAAASVVPEQSSSKNAGKTSPGATTRSTVMRIGRLAPGTSVVVTLPMLVVQAGMSYTLWASVGTGRLPTGPVTATPVGVGQSDEVNIKVASG